MKMRLYTINGINTPCYLCLAPSIAHFDGQAGHDLWRLEPITSLDEVKKGLTYEVWTWDHKAKYYMGKSLKSSDITLDQIF